MKVSVLMTTYNGEKYIHEQLESILLQSRQADEVIICDDCSKDRTVNIIKDFIYQNSLVNWTLYQNKENKGWQRNFIEGLKYTSGDVIFFSDQDDIWLTHKIKTMTDIMEESKHIHCLAGTIIRVDGEGKEFEKRDNHSISLQKYSKKRVPFSKKFNTLILLGCVMCISRKLADALISIGEVNFGHDAQSCRLGEILDGTVVVDLPMIRYRMHEDNTSGVVMNASFGASNLDKRLNDIESNIKWLNKVLQYEKKEGLEEKKLSIIANTIKMQKKRLKYLTKHGFFTYITLLRYISYYSGISMYLGDWAYAHNKNKELGNLFRKIKNN